MFSLHAPTLAVMLIIVTMATGALLLLSWLQNRAVASPAWWGASNLVGGVGIGLLSLRGQAADVLTIDLANAVVHLAFALNWAGTRRFCGRSAFLPAMVAPAMIWLLLCRWDSFYGSIVWRVTASSAVMVGYALASAWELWRARAERLVSRYPAIGWLIAHAVVISLRLPAAFLTTMPTPVEFTSSPLFALSVLEALLNVIALSFLQIAMIRERAENYQRDAALTDPLTGAPNRRALFQRGAHLLDRAAAQRQPACGLLIDIDHFKAINDRCGHAGGDAVLVGVADTMRAHLRGEDFFARIGGEEFVCVLPNTSMSAAMMVAEGLRARVANLKLVNANLELRVSISIGVVCASEGQTMDALLREADRNLYEAKAAGRNRVAAAGSREPETPHLRVA